MEKKTYDFFKEQLAIGKLYETKAQSQLIQYYKNKYVVVSECNDNKYDFVMSNGKAYEVKADLIASKTGYIFIENVQYNKESGIETTEANYYIIIIIVSNYFKQHEKYLKISVKTIKELISNNEYDKVYEDKNKSGYLFRIDVIEKKSKVI